MSTKPSIGSVSGSWDSPIKFERELPKSNLSMHSFGMESINTHLPLSDLVFTIEIPSGIQTCLWQAIKQALQNHSDPNTYIPVGGILLTGSC